MSLLRGVSQADNENSVPRDQEDVSEVTDLTTGPVVFRHDKKLLLAGHFHFTLDQVTIVLNLQNHLTFILLQSSQEYF
jgi:hypothetical protein